MQNFCWVTGPQLCGKLDFDLPVAEIAAMAIVSGLITFATIYFSVTFARRETERTIQSEKTRQLQSAIIEYGESVERRCSEEAPLAKRPPNLSGLHADVLVRQSGFPNAELMADWALALSNYAEAVSWLAKIRPETSEHFTGLELFSPALQLSDRLIGWLQEPGSVNVHLRRRQIERYRSLNHQTRIKILQTMDSEPKRGEKTFASSRPPERQRRSPARPYLS